MLATLLVVFAQAAPPRAAADRISASLEAGGGVEVATSRALRAAGAGRADLGFTTSDRASGVSPYIGVSAWGDTGSDAQAVLGLGVVSLDPELTTLRVRGLAVAGVATYRPIGWRAVPLVGAELSLSKRFGDEARVELGATIGAAAVFPGGAGDTVDAQAVRISSTDAVGLQAWGRFMAAYRVSPNIGLGPFVTLSGAILGNDVLGPTSIESSVLKGFGFVGGAQLVLSR